MPLRNGEHGYGAVTKVLHWLTFSVIVGATTRSEPRGTTCAAATFRPAA